MASWYAVVAAFLYGAHQIFTRMASDHIGEGMGGYVVEGVAALTILVYLAFLYFTNRRNQKFSSEGFYDSPLTGVCVGAGTVAFFLLFQKGGPLSSVPVILASGAAMMAVAGVVLSTSQCPGNGCSSCANNWDLDNRLNALLKRVS